MESGKDTKVTSEQKLEMLRQLKELLRDILTPELQKAIAESVKLAMERSQEGIKTTALGLIECCNAE